MNIKKVLIVYKKSSYATHMLDRKDLHYVKLLKEKNLAIRRSRSNHGRHMEALDSIRQTLGKLGISTDVILRYQLKPVKNYDLTITIGGDGTFLETSHMLEKGLIMGVNSVPEESVGFFCRTRKDNFLRKMICLIRGDALFQSLHRLQITIDGKGNLPLVLNDVLFSNQNPAGTTRYILKVGHTTEEQKSSGLWVSPAPGSTAATQSAGGRVLPIGAQTVQYVVREPCQPPGSHYQLLQGVLGARGKVGILSMMDNAILYIDGPRCVHRVRRGAMVEVSNARRPIMAVW